MENCGILFRFELYLIFSSRWCGVFLLYTTTIIKIKEILFLLNKLNLYYIALKKLNPGVNYKGWDSIKFDWD